MSDPNVPPEAVPGEVNPADVPADAQTAVPADDAVITPPEESGPVPPETPEATPVEEVTDAPVVTEPGPELGQAQEPEGKTLPEPGQVRD